MKSDMQETVDEALTLHLSCLKISLANEISKHDEASRAAWLEQLEGIFERYLGSQRVALTTAVSSSKAPVLASEDSSHTLYTPAMLKFGVSHLEARYTQESTDSDLSGIDEIAVDGEVRFHLQRWWAEEGSSLLWIQGQIQPNALFVERST